MAGRLRRAQSLQRVVVIEVAFAREGRAGSRSRIIKMHTGSGGGRWERGQITALGENQSHSTVSTVSRISDNGDGRVRRFDCADVADGADAK